MLAILTGSLPSYANCSCQATAPDTAAGVLRGALPAFGHPVLLLAGAIGLGQVPAAQDIAGIGLVVLGVAIHQEPREGT